MSATIKIAIVDDHDIFRRGLIQLFNQTSWAEIVGEADSVDAGLKTFAEIAPDVLLLDLYIGRGMRTFDSIPAFKEKSPQTKIVMLTVSESDSDVFEASQYQVDGYILKSTPFAELEQYLQDIFKGETVISESLGSSLFKQLRVKHTAQVLSVREREVLSLLKQGYSNKLIAKKLFISENTVKIHVSNILRKMNVSKRSELSELNLS